MYFENIVILLHSSRNHIEHVWRVLYLLKNAEASPELKKCIFFMDTID